MVCRSQSLRAQRRQEEKRPTEVNVELTPVPHLPEPGGDRGDAIGPRDDLSQVTEGADVR